MDKILNLKVNIQGLEIYEYHTKIDGPLILAFQHQSLVDTILPSLMFNNFIIALKKELFYIPILGFYLKRLNFIFINRSKGSMSLKALLKESKKQHNNGYNILIYPQGTRVLPEDTSNIQPGVYAVQRHLKCKVLPVLIDSGKFWSRRSLIKKPGTIKVSILPPIDCGLDKDAFLNHLNDLYKSSQKN